MHIFYFSFILLFSSCTTSSLKRDVASMGASFENIEAEGASNTAGTGATVPLLARLKDHLQVSVAQYELKNTNTIRQLTQNKTLLAVDYFFPTNFPQIKKHPAVVRGEVQKILQTWQAQYDVVLVGILPSWSSLSSEELSFIKDTNDFGKYKNILDILETYKESVATINFTIQEFAGRYQNVKVLDLRKMIKASKDQFEGKQSLYAYSIPATPFGPDQLHFNDFGQAFLLNLVILPELGPDIPPILQTQSLGRSQMLRSLGTILKSTDDFYRGNDGGYWVEFIQKTQFQLANVKFTKPQDPSMTQIMKISKLIDENALSRPGFPIYLALSAAEKKIISLDLSSALFYKKIDLKEVLPGIYEAWGYDYWMSVNFLSPPRVNYRFRLHSTDARNGIYLLEWTLYPLIKGQSSELVRTSFLDDSISQTLKQGQSGSATYTIEVQVKDL